MLFSDDSDNLMVAAFNIEGNNEFYLKHEISLVISGSKKEILKKMFTQLDQPILAYNLLCTLLNINDALFDKMVSFSFFFLLSRHFNFYSLR